MRRYILLALLLACFAPISAQSQTESTELRRAVIAEGVVMPFPLPVGAHVLKRRFEELVYYAVFENNVLRSCDGYVDIQRNEKGAFGLVVVWRRCLQVP